MGVKSSPRAGPGFQSHPPPKANSCVRGTPQGQDKLKQLPSPPKKNQPWCKAAWPVAEEGSARGQSLERFHRGAGESPESIPKQAHGGWAWTTSISWKQLRTDLLPGWTKPQAGAEGRVKGCLAIAGALCLSAQSCRGKSLLVPNPGGLRSFPILPASPSRHNRQHTGKGPAPDPAVPFLCHPHPPLGDRGPAPEHTAPPPRSERDTGVPAPRCLGAVAGALRPPSPPWQEPVPPQGRPGREAERDGLKAEPGAGGQRATRLCHSGCAARPGCASAASPPAPPPSRLWVQSKEKTSAGSFPEAIAITAGHSPRRLFPAPARWDAPPVSPPPQYFQAAVNP